MATPTVSPVLEATWKLVLDVRSLGLTDDQFGRLCASNPELRLELSAHGELIIMSPSGSKTGWRNGRLTRRLVDWAERDGRGLAFDASAGFVLPNGAKRSPDAAWLRLERWNALTAEEQERYAPICPDFVVELRSPWDSVAELQEKMAEYVDNGAQLGWLVDPFERRVYVYRPGRPVETLDNPATLGGEVVLPGFHFNLTEIW